MSPTGRAAAALAALAVSTLVVPVTVVVLLALALAGATFADALAVRRALPVSRRVPSILSRGVPAPLEVSTVGGTGAVELRQPVPPDLELDPRQGDGAIDARIVARRRGRHVLGPVAVRRTGPLGLGRWDRRAGGDAEVCVYPDLPAARRLATAVREGRFRDGARLTRGPLGLGTEFELIREYVPDDDIRQVNWRATARLDRPMSNQYRVERDRQVICVVDTGRLMAAPLGDRTRLDAALDAAVAVAAVADELGDRCGAVAFDHELRRQVSPRRGGSRAIIAGLFDLEPRPVDSDYERAFHIVGGAKRAFVIVFTDILDPAAARPLLDATPVLARHHVVAVASAVDTEVAALVRQPPASTSDVLRMAVAVDVLAARERVARELRAAGADVVEGRPDDLATVAVAAYLRSKAAARL